MITNYKQYLKLIKEGLIKTYNIFSYETNLIMIYNSVGIDSNIIIHDKLKFDVEILNNINLEKSHYNLIIDECNMLGYYPSYITLFKQNKKNNFKFDIKYLNNLYDKIIIRFEAKYSDGLYSNDIVVPEYLYHLTPKNKLQKILKNGLSPKSNNRISNHSERIYFFKNINNYNTLLNRLKLNDKLNNKEIDYVLLKVKTNKNTIYHIDPNYTDGVYTYDNIHPKNVEIIKI